MLIAATLVMAAFLLLTGLVLDNAFRRSAEKAMRDRLQGHIYTLLAAAEPDKHGVLQVPASLPEPRFSTIGSGLYAEIIADQKKRLWRSPSALGITAVFKKKTRLGKNVFEHIGDKKARRYYSLSFAIVQEVKGRDKQYLFRVYESLDRYTGQVQKFRNSMLVWFGAAAVLLLLFQALIIRWGMRPLVRVSNDLAEVEAGRQEQLTGQYPSDLRSLTDNLNTLIKSSRSHLQRYRDSLGNLAHSLKTPIAVLQVVIDDDSVTVDEVKRTTQEQIDRMREIVEYQLQRASASGRTALSKPVPVLDVVTRIVSALEKVHASKNVQCDFEIEKGVVFYGDEDDLMEALGNLIDNAYKWCDQKVRISAEAITSLAREYPGLKLTIEDDGPGVPQELTESVRQRGQRADTQVPGHGLGLAMVQDTLQIYNGSLSITDSDLGGACFEARFE